MNNQQQLQLPQSITETFSSSMQTAIQSPKKQKSQSYQENFTVDLPDKIQNLTQSTLNQYLKNFISINQFQKIQKGKPLIELCKQSSGLKIVKSLINKCYKLFKSPIPAAVLCSFQFIRQLIEIGHFTIINKVQSLFLMNLVQIIEYRSHIKTISRGNSYFLCQTYRNVKDQSNNDLIRLSMTLFRMVHESLYVWGKIYFSDSNFGKLYKKLQKQVYFPKFPQQFKFYNQNKVQVFLLQFKKNKKQFYQDYLKKQNSKILQQNNNKSQAVIKNKKPIQNTSQEMNLQQQNQKDQRKQKIIKNQAILKSKPSKRKIIQEQQKILNVQNQNEKNYQRSKIKASQSKNIKQIKNIKEISLSSIDQVNFNKTLQQKNSQIDNTDKIYIEKIKNKNNKQEGFLENTAIQLTEKTNLKIGQKIFNQNNNQIESNNNQITKEKSKSQQQLKKERPSKIQKVSKKNMSKKKKMSKQIKSITSQYQQHKQQTQIHSTSNANEKKLGIAKQCQNRVYLSQVQDLTKNIQELHQSHQYTSNPSKISFNKSKKLSQKIIKQKQIETTFHNDNGDDNDNSMSLQQKYLSNGQRQNGMIIQGKKNINKYEKQQKQLQQSQQQSQQKSQQSRKTQLKLKQKQNKFPDLPLGIIYQRSLQSSSKQTQSKFSRTQEQFHSQEQQLNKRNNVYQKKGNMKKNQVKQKQDIRTDILFIASQKNSFEESLSKIQNISTKNKNVQDQIQVQEDERFEMHSQISQSKSKDVEKVQIQIQIPLQTDRNKQSQTVNSVQQQVKVNKNQNSFQCQNQNVNQNQYKSQDQKRRQHQNQQQGQQNLKQNLKQSQKSHILLKNKKIPTKIIRLPQPQPQNQPFLQKIQKKIEQQLLSFKKQIIQKIQNNLQLRTMETLQNIKKINRDNQFQKQNKNKQIQGLYHRRNKCKSKRRSIKFAQILQSETEDIQKQTKYLNIENSPIIQRKQKKQYGVNTEQNALFFNKNIEKQESSILKNISQKLKITFSKKENDQNNFQKIKNENQPFMTAQIKQFSSNFRKKTSSRLRQTSQIKLSERNSKSKGKRNSLQLSQKINQFCPYPQNSLLYSLSKRKSIF